MIVSAEENDSNILTDVALKSKAFWNYSSDLLESWREDLTVPELMIQEMNVFKYVYENEIIGFYILSLPKEKSIELEFLFVLPDFIGKGIGSQLIQHAFEKALLLKCKQMNVLADPNAVSFYESKGFEIVDKKESSIADRFLPVMLKDLIK